MNVITGAITATLLLPASKAGLHPGIALSGISSSWRRRYTPPMSKTLVDIDPTLLEEARRQLGTRTIKDTVNQALAAVVARSRRKGLVDLLVSGGLPDLGSDEVMGSAWR